MATSNRRIKKGPWQPKTAFQSTPRAANAGGSPARNEWSLLPLRPQRGFADVVANLLVTTLAVAVVAGAPVIAPLAPRPALIQYAPQNLLVLTPAVAAPVNSYNYPQLKPVPSILQDVPQSGLALAPPAALPFNQMDWSLLKTRPPAYVQWTPYYFTGFIPSVTPTGEPSHLTWGSFSRCSRIMRGIRIPEQVAEVIEEIVQATPTPVVLSDTRKIAKNAAAQQEAILRAELKAEGIAWRKMYAEALVEMWQKKNEEEAILVILMSA